MFEFGEGLFDGIEVRAVGRQVADFSTDGFDGPSDFRAVVGRQVVHDDDIAGMECRHQLLLHVSHEQVTIHGAINDHGRCHSRGPQRRDKSGGLPMAMRHSVDETLADGAAAIASGHVGFGPRFVDENDFVGIEA